MVMRTHESYLLIFAPHFGQNLAPGRNELPHSMQKAGPCGSILVPHFGQNFAVSGKEQ